MKFAKQKGIAFTLFELCLVVAVLVILFCFFAPTTLDHRAKGKAIRIRCVSNLKNVGLAYRLYAADQNDLFPWENSVSNALATNHALSDLFTFVRSVAYVPCTPAIFSCPADNRPPLTNWTDFVSVKQISYFLGVDSSSKRPQSIVAGDRNLTNNSGPLALGARKIGADFSLGWDSTIHKTQGDLLIADGSVQQVSSARLKDQVRAALIETNRPMTWIVP